MIKFPSPPPRSQVVSILVGLVVFLSALPVLFFNEQRIDPNILEVAASSASTISQLHVEYIVITWALRVFGFALMWLGMLLLWLPLARMLKVWPYLEHAKMASLVFVTLPLALALATVVVLLSIVLSNIGVIILTGILAPSLLLAVLRYNRQKPPQLPFA